MAWVLDRGKDGIDDLDRAVKIGLVIKPAPVSSSFTNSKTIDTTGQTVNVKDDMHAIA